MPTDLLRRVSEILTGYNMLRAGDQIGVAVSGGADSVVLLYILHALASDFDVRLSVLHVNHQLRGAESDADELFVRSLAGRLRLPFWSERRPLPPGNVEEEARHARRRFFASLNMTRTALGHTRTDQAETVLFRLLRGSGLTGLAGMSPISANGIIRPLLFVSRDDIREFAKAGAIEWRDDSSNLDVRFRRNRLRLQTIPELARHFNPALEKALAGTASMAQAEEDYWTDKIRAIGRKLLQPHPLGLILNVDQLQSRPLAVQRRLLRLAIRQMRGSLRSIDLAHVDGVLAICRSKHGHDRLIIPGVDAIRSFDQLLLTPPSTMREVRDYELTLSLGENLTLPFHSGTILVSRVDANGQNCVNVKGERKGTVEQAYLDSAGLDFPSGNPDGSGVWRVRNWQPGDHFERPGASSTTKIKFLFQESRIALWDRRHWPVIVVGNQIAWVRAFGVSARFIPARESGATLCISFQPGK